MAIITKELSRYFIYGALEEGRESVVWGSLLYWATIDQHIRHKDLLLIWVGDWGNIVKYNTVLGTMLCQARDVYHSAGDDIDPLLVHTQTNTVVEFDHSPQTSGWVSISNIHDLMVNYYDVVEPYVRCGGFNISIEKEESFNPPITKGKLGQMPVWIRAKDISRPRYYMISCPPLAD